MIRIVKQEWEEIVKLPSNNQVNIFLGSCEEFEDLELDDVSHVVTSEDTLLRPGVSALIQFEHQQLLLPVDGELC